MNNSKRPILRGSLTEVIPHWYPGPDEGQEHQICQLDVFCPYCDRLHSHGWNPADNARRVTHRVAHCCNPASPFSKGGYWISIWRESDPGGTQHVTPPGHAIVRQKQQRLQHGLRS